MKLSISYKIMKHGWAKVCFCDGKTTINSAVSYFHDSLSDLAEMAISIQSGQLESTVIFLDEPGKLVFVVNILDKKAHYEVRRFRNWSSRGSLDNTEDEVLLIGITTSKQIVQQITSVLLDIHQNIGPKRYRELWCMHYFPTQQYESLTKC